MKTIKASRPRKFEISTGGYSGPYFEVAYQNGELLYGKSPYPGIGLNVIEQPDDQSWEKILASLQKIDIFPILYQYLLIMH